MLGAPGPTERRYILKIDSDIKFLWNSSLDQILNGFSSPGESLPKPAKYPPQASHDHQSPSSDEKS